MSDAILIKRTKDGRFKKGTPSLNKKYNLVGFGTGSRLYIIWRNMKDRCYNKNCKFYYNYGDRGISVSNNWLDYNNFLKWALESGYSKELTIDRIDNNKGYTPDNCRWATKFEQGRNRRNVKFYTFAGFTETLNGFSKILNINRSTLEMRIFSYGWDIHRALSTPVKK